MNAELTDFHAVREDLELLRSDFSTLLIATTSQQGEPNASYAAYVERDGDYFVYVSELSIHTQNLLANGKASVLFIEDEANAGHLFARKRLTYQCDAFEVERDREVFDEVMGLLAERFGNLIDMLRGLRDFHLFRLSPRQGLFVAGFAQAYEVADPRLGELRHIRDKGHSKSTGGTVSPEDAPGE
jgi:hypothetical protein